ncbi:hypothetical protein O6H91_07G069000 [Diphasiastrum complanatum]|uniref:Uncharacterized protein n=1 Tax=Diphasiastrum complanatum TaxID=34168 RepID=A0ACC2D6D0_DIPCM|nr:hypothetical protein O6H91_07G069000 [Diphasiastrum complanatum]
MDKILQVKEKPSRSDDISSPEEQQNITKHTKDHFDALAPKRPLKPTRSEPREGNVFQDDWHNESDIPEYNRLKDLNATSEPLWAVEGAVPGDEYHENDYYKDLIAANKIEHRTTGSGFIKVENNAVSFHLEDDAASGQPAWHGCKCNPATNDWIPSPELVFQSSQKPHRSDP